ncbi:MAG: hypothetical protein GY866_40305 [Proteobacteria bacterium]|nr:hypothetical protein [Pseudomonadota bacterium]
MGFDIDFFKELQKLTATAIAPVRPQAYRPTVKELFEDDLVSKNFFDQTIELVKTLYHKSKKKYHFAFEFRVYPQHILDFTKGMAFRRQMNIGFTAGNNEGEHTARIGLGFLLNYNAKPKGIDEYLHFLDKVKKNPADFDTTFSKLGSYGEPESVFNPRLSASAVLKDSPDYNDDWRFYGKQLNLRDHADILTSIDSFVDEVIAVFEHIQHSGFY